MSALDSFFAGAAASATASAADAASSAAAAKFEEFKPWLELVGFLLATIYLFYFLPRFLWPWERAS